MPLGSSSFWLYTDSGLTTPFTGVKSLAHESDLSDNPTDFVLYFGSNSTTTQLQASSDPGVDNIVFTPTDALADWESEVAYSAGDLVEPTTPNTYVYKCTTAGTSDVSEPSWPVGGVGSTVSDGTVVWTLMGKRHELTEIKMALSSGGLPGASAGAALNVAVTIEGGVANAVPVYFRITNAVTDIRSNINDPELKIYINDVIESEIV